MKNKQKATIYDFARYCKSHNYNCNICDLHHYGCSRLIEWEHIDVINNLIIEWCTYNPLKTYKQDFLKKFPNAPIEELTGEPIVCLLDIYGENVIECSNKCASCWNTPMED